MRLALTRGEKEEGKTSKNRENIRNQKQLPRENNYLSLLLLLLLLLLVVVVLFFSFSLGTGRL